MGTFARLFHYRQWYHYRVTVAFTLPGSIQIYSFSLIIGISASLGMLWSAVIGGWDRAPRILPAGLVSLVGAALGGRMVYLAVNWGYFRDAPSEIIQIPFGGLSWPGALAGAFLALGLSAIITSQSFGALAEALFPLFTSVAIGGFLGCWIDGCAYGETASFWWAALGRDEWGNVLDRVPLQLIGALGVLVLAWGVDVARRRWDRFLTPARRVALAFAGFGILMGVLTPSRADLGPEIFGARMDYWAAWGLVILSSLTFIISYFNTQQKHKSHETIPRPRTN